MRLQSHIERVIHSFNFREQALLIGLSILCVVGFIGIMSYSIQTLTKRMPEQGGMYREGFVGSPTSPLPILASTDSDKSISTLVYSGILKKQSWNNYVPDIGSCVYDTQKPLVTCIRLQYFFK